MINPNDVRNVIRIFFGLFSGVEWRVNRVTNLWFKWNFKFVGEIIGVRRDFRGLHCDRSLKSLFEEDGHLNTLFR